MYQVQQTGTTKSSWCVRSDQGYEMTHDTLKQCMSMCDNTPITILSHIWQHCRSCSTEHITQSYMASSQHL